MYEPEQASEAIMFMYRLKRRAFEALRAEMTLALLRRSPAEMAVRRFPHLSTP